MDYPKVEIQEVTSERDLLINTTVPNKVDLGGRHNLEAALAETSLDSLRRSLRQKEARVFLLKWEGGKIPRGVKVVGHEIAGTQNGQVITTEGKDIGSYDRLVEFGGESGEEQQMLVYVRASAVRVNLKL